MKVELIAHTAEAGKLCGEAAAVCTNSKNPESSLRHAIGSGHESVLEHASFSVLFTVDRGVSHEIVRHRLASFAQESTRYCNYRNAGEITVIEPCYLIPGTAPYKLWQGTCQEAEDAYMALSELMR